MPRSIVEDFSAISRRRDEIIGEGATLHGKSLALCTVEELRAEWEAGEYLDGTIGLTRAQEMRLNAIENELGRRSP